MNLEFRHGLHSIGIADREHRRRIAQFAVIAILILSIEFLPRFGLVARTTLIPLSEMFSHMLSLVASGEILPHVRQTLTAILAAYTLAVTTGVPTGVLLWKYDTLKDVLDPYLLTFYAVPIFAFYPLLISILGLNILPIIVIAWLFSVIIIVTNTASGLNEIPDIYPKVGHDLNLSRLKLFRYVYLPAATPYVFSGLKLGFIYALIGTVASEFILATEGLGWLISFHYDSFDIQTMYAAMLFVILFSLAVNVGLILVERQLYRRAST